MAKGWEYTLLLRTFRDIIVSSRFHYLLSSNSQWRFLRGTTPWVVAYSLFTYYSPRLPPQWILAGLENVLKNRVGLGNPQRQWTSHYYVVTFHLQLTDTFPLSFSICIPIKCKVCCLWMDESSGPPTSQAIFWTTRYYTTLWDIPTSTLQDYFVTYVLVDNGQGWFRHHPFVIIPFGFKYPLILNPAVIRLDYLISHINSTSYSYCSSELNSTTHIAESYFHFIYSVTLDY